MTTPILRTTVFLVVLLSGLSACSSTNCPQPAPSTTVIHAEPR